MKILIRATHLRLYDRQYDVCEFQLGKQMQMLLLSADCSIFNCPNTIPVPKLGSLLISSRGGLAGSCGSGPMKG